MCGLERHCFRIFEISSIDNENAAGKFSDMNVTIAIIRLIPSSIRCKQYSMMSQKNNLRRKKYICRSFIILLTTSVIPCRTSIVIHLSQCRLQRSNYSSIINSLSYRMEHSEPNNRMNLKIKKSPQRKSNQIRAKIEKPTVIFPELTYIV